MSRTKRRKVNKNTDLRNRGVSLIDFRRDLLNKGAQNIFTKLYSGNSSLDLKCFSMFSIAAPFREKAYLLMTIGKYFGISEKRLEKPALASELIMAGVLTADDVIDQSLSRKDKASGLARYGAEKSYLIAECIYASALELLIGEDPEILGHFVNAYRNIQIGQYLTLEYSRKKKYLTKETLDRLAYLKAGSLFEATAAAAAYVAKNNKYLKEFRKFGKHVGVALQHWNDISDFSWTKKSLGRIGYEDLKNGLPNLVLAYLAENKKITSEDRKLVFDIWKRGSNKINNSELKKLERIIKENKAIEQAQKYLDKHCQLAASQLDKLPENKHLKYLFEFLDILREV